MTGQALKSNFELRSLQFDFGGKEVQAHARMTFQEPIAAHAASKAGANAHADAVIA
jgi:hypothetical protein